MVVYTYTIVSILNVHAGVEVVALLLGYIGGQVLHICHHAHCDDEN